MVVLLVSMLRKLSESNKFGLAWKPVVLFGYTSIAARFKTRFWRSVVAESHHTSEPSALRPEGLGLEMHGAAAARLRKDPS